MSNETILDCYSIDPDIQICIHLIKLERLTENLPAFLQSNLPKN